MASTIASWPALFLDIVFSISSPSAHDGCGTLDALLHLAVDSDIYHLRQPIARYGDALMAHWQKVAAPLTRRCDISRISNKPRFLASIVRVMLDFEVIFWQAPVMAKIILECASPRNLRINGGRQGYFNITRLALRP